MTIEITDEIVAIAEEFSMSKYSSKLERDAALLLEIVILRKENEHLRKEITSLKETVDYLKIDEDERYYGYDEQD